MKYRHSDYGRRGRRPAGSSGQGKEALSGFLFFVGMLFNFLIAILAVTAVAIVIAGWLKFVAFGKVSNDTYWHRLAYDTIHISRPAARLRLKRFVQGVIQSGDSSASLA